VVRRAVCEVHGKKYVFAVKSINATQQDHRKQLLNDLREYLFGGYSEYLIEFYTCFFHDGLVKQVIEYMDMGALKNVIQHVTSKKIVLSEEEMATIIFNVHPP
jgi:serine/threonine protein kinase